MIDLKLCPFCGGNGKVIKLNHKGANGEYKIFIKCERCGGRTYTEYPLPHDSYLTRLERVVSIWNTRTNPEKDRLQQENEQLRHELEGARANIQAACQYGWSIADGSKKENEQLRELVRLAVEDMKYCNNCDACKFKDCQPSCKRGSFGCGLECECCQCLHENNFTWQHANKLKELGVEV